MIPWSAVARHRPPSMRNDHVDRPKPRQQRSHLKATVFKFRVSIFQSNRGRCRATALQGSFRLGLGRSRPVFLAVDDQLDIRPPVVASGRIWGRPRESLDLPASARTVSNRGINVELAFVADRKRGQVHISPGALCVQCSESPMLIMPLSCEVAHGAALRTPIPIPWQSAQPRRQNHRGGRE